MPAISPTSMRERDALRHDVGRHEEAGQRPELVVRMLLRERVRISALKP